MIDYVAFRPRIRPALDWGFEQLDADAPDRGVRTDPGGVGRPVGLARLAGPGW
jgi:hypothetical protein